MDNLTVVVPARDWDWQGDRDSESNPLQTGTSRYGLLPRGLELSRARDARGLSGRGCCDAIGRPPPGDRDSPGPIRVLVPRQFLSHPWFFSRVDRVPTFVHEVGRSKPPAQHLPPPSPSFPLLPLSHHEMSFFLWEESTRCPGQDRPANKTFCVVKGRLLLFRMTRSVTSFLPIKGETPCNCLACASLSPFPTLSSFLVSNV
jgi:hypothetical protein